MDDVQTDVQPTWLDGTTAENRQLIESKGWSDVNAALNSYVQLESAMGGRVKIPDENSTQEERSAFYNGLGRPESPDGYEIDRPEKLPEGMTYSEKFEMSMRSIAHEIGITKDQLKRLAKAFNDYQITTFGEQQEASKQAAQQAQMALEQKWAADYKKNYEIVERACVELIPDKELREKFSAVVDEKGLRNHPVFAEVFLAIGKSMLDDTMVKGETKVADDGEYRPEFHQDPDMYAHGDSEESQRARAWFEARGHVYS